MLTIQQYVLTKIAEEASEVAQRALKAQQFGLEQIEPGKDQNNAQRLQQEFYDLSYWVAFAEKNNYLPRTKDAVVQTHMHAKAAKAGDFMRLSIREGQLENLVLVDE